jgi:hypothetical protein
MGEQGSVDVEKRGFDHGTDSCGKYIGIISSVLDNFNHAPTKLHAVFVKKFHRVVGILFTSEQKFGIIHFKRRWST